METALNENMKDIDALYRSLLRKLRRYDPSLFTKTGVPPIANANNEHKELSAKSFEWSNTLMAFPEFTKTDSLQKEISHKSVNITNENDVSLQVQTQTTLYDITTAFNVLFNNSTASEHSLMYKEIQTVARTFKRNFSMSTASITNAKNAIGMSIGVVAFIVVFVIGYNSVQGNFWKEMYANLTPYTAAGGAGGIGALIIFFMYMSNHMQRLNDDKSYGRYLFNKLNDKCKLKALDTVGENITTDKGKKNDAIVIAKFMKNYCNNFVLNPRDSVALTARIKTFFDRQKLFLNKRFQSLSYKSDVDKKVTKLFNIFVEETSSDLTNYIRTFASAPVLENASSAPEDSGEIIANLTESMKDIRNSILKKTIRHNTLITLQQKDGGSTYAFLSYMIKEILGSTFSGLDGNTLFQALQRVSQHQANTASAGGVSINANVLADPARAITNIDMIVTYIEDDVKNQRIIAEPVGTPSTPSQFVDLNLFNQIMADTSIAQLQKSYNEMRVIEGVMNSELSHSQIQSKLEYNAAAYKGGYKNTPWVTYLIVLITGGLALAGFAIDEGWIGASANDGASTAQIGGAPLAEIDVANAAFNAVEEAKKDASGKVSADLISNADNTRTAAITTILATGDEKKSKPYIDAFLNAPVTEEERQKRLAELNKLNNVSAKSNNESTNKSLDSTIKLVIVVCIYIFVGVMGYGLISRYHNDMTFAYTNRDDNSTGLINDMTELMSMIKDLQSLKKLSRTPTNEDLAQIYKYVYPTQTNNGSTKYVSSTDDTLQFNVKTDAIKYATEQQVHDLYYQYIKVIDAYNSDNYFRPELIQVPFPWTEILMNFVMLVICIMVLTIAFTNFSPYKNAARISTASKCIDRAEVIKGETMEKNTISAITKFSGGDGLGENSVLKENMVSFNTDFLKFDTILKERYKMIVDYEKNVLSATSSSTSSVPSSASSVSSSTSSVPSSIPTNALKELIEITSVPDDKTSDKPAAEIARQTIVNITYLQGLKQQFTDNADNIKDKINMTQDSKTRASAQLDLVNKNLKDYYDKIAIFDKQIKDIEKERDDTQRESTKSDSKIKYEPSAWSTKSDGKKGEKEAYEKANLETIKSNITNAQSNVNNISSLIKTYEILLKRFNDSIITVFTPQIDALLKQGLPLMKEYKSKYENKALEKQLAQLEGKCVIMDEQIDDSAQQQVIKVSIMVAVISSTLYMSNVILNSSVGYGSALQQMRHM